jgi:hypothetical protein
LIRSYINKILRPAPITLIIFGIVTFFILLAYVWWYSFTWDFVFGVTFYIAVLAISISVALLAAIFLDRRYGLQVKRYFIVALAELLLIWLAANPVRTIQIEKSFAKGEQLAKSIDKFRNDFGIYPSSLEEIEVKLKLDLSKRSYLGTLYEYELAGRDSYSLRFISYYGYTAIYNGKERSWIVVD